MLITIVNLYDGTKKFTTVADILSRKSNDPLVNACRFSSASYDGWNGNQKAIEKEDPSNTRPSSNRGPCESAETMSAEFAGCAAGPVRGCLRTCPHCRLRVGIHDLGGLCVLTKPAFLTRASSVNAGSPK